MDGIHGGLRVFTVDQEEDYGLHSSIDTLGEWLPGER